MAKRIGVFGLTSYIGKYFTNFMKNSSDYEIFGINSRTEEWKSGSLGSLDVILCVAGIAHVSTDPRMETQYYKVNRDLPIELALRAKKDGVGHFVFFSSMIVYGDDDVIGEKKIITKDTPVNPKNFYGKSKLEAEEKILSLGDDKFTVLVLRLPMVYGPACKGNFQKLVWVGKFFPFFPDINNQRSMIFIDNLCFFLQECLDKRYNGIYFPQNTDYVSTKEIVNQVASVSGREIRFVKFLNPILVGLAKYIGFINKVFGSKVYDKSLSPGMDSYSRCSFQESIRRCITPK